MRFVDRMVCALLLGSAAANVPEAQAADALSDAGWAALVDRRVELTLDDGSVVAGQLIAVDTTTVTVVQADGLVRAVERAKVTTARRAVIRVTAPLGGAAEGGTSAAPAAVAPAPVAGVQAWERSTSALPVEKGRLLVHALFEPSAYGLLPRLDLRANLLGFVVGPNIAARWQVAEVAGIPIAVEPDVFFGWAPSTYAVGGTVRASVPAAGGALDLAVAVRYHHLWGEFEGGGDGDITWSSLVLLPEVSGLESSIDDDDDSGAVRGVRIPVSGALYLPTAKGATWTVAATLEPANIATGNGYFGSLRGAWSTAAGPHTRVSVGLTVIAPGTAPDFQNSTLDDAAADARAELDIPVLPVLAAPYLAVWWVR